MKRLLRRLFALAAPAVWRWAVPKVERKIQDRRRREDQPTAHRRTQGRRWEGRNR